MNQPQVARSNARRVFATHSRSARSGSMRPSPFAVMRPARTAFETASGEQPRRLA